ncbi:hypothetical protein F2P79_023973 [Pimephales promelas]|nr:hypothetical protein F2P79_023973 [Pimephales promelas]
MADRAREIVNNLLANSDFIETVAAACDRQETQRSSNSASVTTSSTVHQTTEAEVRSLFNRGTSARPAPAYNLRHFPRPRKEFRDTVPVSEVLSTTLNVGMDANLPVSASLQQPEVT